MSRLEKLYKNQEFIKALQFAFMQFEIQYNVTASSFFADKLHYETPNQFLNNFQTFSYKFLKVDELFIILDNLGENRNHLINFICDKYNFVAVPKNQAPALCDLEKTLLQLPISQGNLFQNYLSAIVDNKIDESEHKKLKDIIYILSQNLLSFEKQISLMVQE